MNVPYEVELQKIIAKLNEYQNFLIISHRGPDGDTVGSNLALQEALREQLGKNVVSACFDPLPGTYSFLEKTEEFIEEFDYKNFDCIITVDIATEGLFKFQEKYPDILDGTIPVINIDHHHDNTNFGSLNLVFPEAATCIIIYQLLKKAQLHISRTIATALLAGIYFDTGSLMHSNTTPSVYRICANLIAKGADFKTISKYLFHIIPLNKLQLWGRIFERIHQNEDGVVMSAVMNEDFVATGTESEDASGIIDYLNMAEGAKFCMLLNENNKKGLVKGSLRTLHDNVNVSDVAHKFGGGGHKKASGFAIPGKLVQEIRWKVLPD